MKFLEAWGLLIVAAAGFGTILYGLGNCVEAAFKTSDAGKQGRRGCLTAVVGLLVFAAAIALIMWLIP